MWCSPLALVLPCTHPGRLRFGSRPLSTWIEPAPYVSAEPVATAAAASSPRASRTRCPRPRRLDASSSPTAMAPATEARRRGTTARGRTRRRWPTRATAPRGRARRACLGARRSHDARISRHRTRAGIQRDARGAHERARARRASKRHRAESRASPGEKGFPPSAPAPRRSLPRGARSSRETPLAARDLVHRYITQRRERIRIAAARRCAAPGAPRVREGVHPPSSKRRDFAASSDLRRSPKRTDGSGRNRTSDLWRSVDARESAFSAMALGSWI